MTWTPPLTWSPGPPAVTAAQLNQYVRDNQKALIAYCHTIRTSTGTFSASGSFQSFTPDSALVDTASMFSAGTPSRVTAPVAGKYRVRGRMSGAASINAIAQIRKNGTTVVLGGAIQTGALEIGEWDIPLAAADYLEFGIQTGTGTYTLSTTGLPVLGLSGDFTVEWIAP